MSALSSLYIKEETLKTLLDTIQKKGERGIVLTIALNDEGDQYQQNVSAWVGQTKEQVADKVRKYYIGNGRVFWTDGKAPVVIERKQEPATPIGQPVAAGGIGADDDLPF